jgi:hypothetical protein
MKKLILVLCVAIVLVAVYATYSLAIAMGTTLCYGTVTQGLTYPYPPSAGATMTCIEDGSTATSLSDGTFILNRNGKASAGTYHIVATKAPAWRSDTISFYYNGSTGTNVGEVHMRSID